MNCDGEDVRLILSPMTPLRRVSRPVAGRTPLTRTPKTTPNIESRLGAMLGRFSAKFRFRKIPSPVANDGVRCRASVPDVGGFVAMRADIARL